MFDKIKDFVSDITGGKDMGELDLGGAEKYLEGITYPISKDELKTALKAKGVPDQVLAFVDKLPDQIFDSQDDLVKGLSAVAGAGGLAGLADKAGDLLDSTKANAEGKLDSAKADVEGKLDVEFRVGADPFVSVVPEQSREPWARPPRVEHVVPRQQERRSRELGR